jgi:hypothetical protein
MAKSKDNVTQDLKEILSAEVGGAASDWKRLSKKRVYGGDTAREFENTSSGQKVTTYERADGLVYAELGEGGKEITARVPFNAAAKPSVVDVVMNKILEDKEVPDALYAQAVKEGLIKRFSFCVTKYDDGIVEEGESPMYTTIYPTVRDETFKCPEFIRPMVPKGDATDECMVTEWRFPAAMNTPAKVVKHLESLGLTWDVESQKRDKAVYKEITTELNAAKTATPASNRGPKR